METEIIVVPLVRGVLLAFSGVEARGAVEPPYNTQDSPFNKDYPAPTVRTAKVEKPELTLHPIKMWAI